MYERMKQALKIVLILLGITLVVYIIATAYLNDKKDKRMRPILEQEVDKALGSVEAISSYDVLGKELTKIYVDIDIWNAATEGQQQQFVKDAQNVVTSAAIKAGYDMDLYSGIMIYDLGQNKIAEADSAGKVTIY